MDGSEGAAITVTTTIYRGAVDWTGDNPFIYLKTDPSGDYSCLALHFRIAMSAYGTGQVMLVLEAPYRPLGHKARRLCLTNNEPLARYLVEEFVKHFGLFRPCAALLDEMPIVTGAQFASGTPESRSHRESANVAGTHCITMLWDELQPPFMAHVPAHASQTRVHEMFSVFRPAGRATIEVDAEVIPGAATERDFFGRRAQSAALAFSETWVHSISPTGGADATAAERVESVDPVLTGVPLVREVLPGLGKVVLHAGPSYVSVDHIPRPVLNSMCVASVFEGWAADFVDAEHQVLTGKIGTAAAQDHGLAVPLAGVLTASMAVLEISDVLEPERRVFAALNEGQNHATRLGRLDSWLPSHLRWLHETLPGALKSLCDPPLRLLPVIDAALREGDDCHARTVAGSTFLTEYWRSRGGRDASVRAFLEESPAFALSFWMGVAALGARAAIDVSGAHLVTHAGGNGHEFGIKISGRSSAWTRCAAPVPSGRIEPACEGATPVGALGDSAVIDFAGLGAQALRRAPLLRESLAAHLPKNILGRPGRVLSGVETDGPWRLRATNARRCVDAGTGPAVLIGMIDAAGSRGRIGGGVVDVPVSLFARALDNSGS